MILFADPREQQVWATVHAMNLAWTRGNPDDLAHYFHPRMLALTASENLRRDVAEACMAGRKAFARTCPVKDWREIDPIVRMFGDAAVVSYYYKIEFLRDGRNIKTGGRDMFFLVCENGRWWIVGDHFSGYPGA